MCVVLVAATTPRNKHIDRPSLSDISCSIYSAVPPSSPLEMRTVGPSGLCQAGTGSFDYLRACAETTDGNVVVAGFSKGSVNGTVNDGEHDIVAVKLDINTGEEIWTYQVGWISDAKGCRRIYRVAMYV